MVQCSRQLNVVQEMDVLVHLRLLLQDLAFFFYCFLDPSNPLQFFLLILAGDVLVLVLGVEFHVFKLMVEQLD